MLAKYIDSVQLWKRYLTPANAQTDSYFSLEWNLTVKQQDLGKCVIWRWSSHWDPNWITRGAFVLREWNNFSCCCFLAALPPPPPPPPPTGRPWPLLASRLRTRSAAVSHASTEPLGATRLYAYQELRATVHRVHGGVYAAEQKNVHVCWPFEVEFCRIDRERGRGHRELEGFNGIWTQTRKQHKECFFAARRRKPNPCSRYFSVVGS